MGGSLTCSHTQGKETAQMSSMRLLNMIGMAMKWTNKETIIETAARPNLVSAY